MSPCGIEPVRVLGQNEPKMQTPWMEDPDMSVLRLGGVGDLSSSGLMKRRYRRVCSREWLLTPAPKRTKKYSLTWGVFTLSDISFTPGSFTPCDDLVLTRRPSGRPSSTYRLPTFTYRQSSTDRPVAVRGHHAHQYSAASLLWCSFNSASTGRTAMPHPQSIRAAAVGD